MPDAMNYPDLTKMPESFKALIGNQELNYHVYNFLPMPIEVFAPDGTAIFVNRAMLEFKNTADFYHIAEKLNIKNDPVCLRLLGSENVAKILSGEAYICTDITAPIPDPEDQGVLRETSLRSAALDILFLPVWDGSDFVCSIAFFTIKNIFRGREDIVKAQEYIMENWQEDFDLDKIAASANLSPRHFRRIFKELTGVSPISYYQNVKLEKIQEKLLDSNLSIERAFTDCNADYRGAYLKLFKSKYKVSPSQYRKMRLRK